MESPGPQPLEAPILDVARQNVPVEPWLRSRPIIFLGLLLVGSCLAIITYFWNRSFEAKKMELAVEWSDRGEAVLREGSG